MPCRLLESITSAAHVTQTAVKALIASESSEESAVHKVTFNLEEVYPSSRSAPSRSAIVLLPGESKVVTLVNSLTHDRRQLVGIRVRTVKVMVSHCPCVCVFSIKLQYYASEKIMLICQSRPLVQFLTLGACTRVTVVVLCVCLSVRLSVCYRASGYIPRLYVENKVPLGFLWCFQDMQCVAFVENALFKSSGDIC